MVLEGDAYFEKSRSDPLSGLLARKSLVAKWLLFGTLGFFLLFPMVPVLLYSLATSWTANFLPNGYTLKTWLEGFGEERMRDAILRSTGLAVAVVALDIVLVVPAAYWARVRNPRIRLITELSAVIPFALPYVVIAYGILTLVGDYAPGLLGTRMLVLLGHAAIAFPFLYWAVDGAMAASNIQRLSEAAETCGAHPMQILRRVVMPNILVGTVSGGILVFAVSFNEFALSQQLVGARFETLPLWQANELKSSTSNFNLLAASTFFTFVILFLLSVAVVYKFRGQEIRLLPGARAMEGK